jgi:4-oxalomesaconate tautomerase
MLESIPCTIMRGGTSKGLYFRASDLPADRATRDRVLLAVMGSPDPRQIDGLGGAHPLTSKVAVVGPPSHPDADVDYLFLQVSVTEALVSDAQNCGNLLAGIGRMRSRMGSWPSPARDASAHSHGQHTQRGGRAHRDPARPGRVRR